MPTMDTMAMKYVEDVTRRHEKVASDTRLTQLRWIGVVVFALSWFIARAPFFEALWYGFLATVGLAALHLYRQMSGKKPLGAPSGPAVRVGFPPLPPGPPDALRNSLAPVKALPFGFSALPPRTLHERYAAAAVGPSFTVNEAHWRDGRPETAASLAPSAYALPAAGNAAGAWHAGMTSPRGVSNDTSLYSARPSAALSRQQLSTSMQGFDVDYSTVDALLAEDHDFTVGDREAGGAGGAGALEHWRYAGAAGSGASQRGAGGSYAWNAGGGSAGGGVAGGNGLRVRFEAPARARQGDATMAAQSDWARLGVRDLATSTARVREWVRDVLSTVAADMRRVDRFFAERQLVALECAANLSELTEAPAAPAATSTTGGFGGATTGGFGAAAGGTTGGFGRPAAGAGGFGSTTTTAGTTGGFGAASAGGFGASSAARPGFGSSGAATSGGFGAAAAKPTGMIKKLDYLLLEKHRITNTAQHLPESYKLASIMDRRLQIEALLNIGLTFPEGERPVEALAMRQAYVVRRINMLAEQPGLSGYSHNGGDAELWHDGLPCDAQIVCHVLRYHLSSLARHIRLAHDQPTERNEISICIGHVGEPYFFVRYRQQATDLTLHTVQGRDSLFHALLLFAGIIATYHEGAYGGVFGVVDLDKLKLSSVI
jgi:hypothetical protein